MEMGKPREFYVKMTEKDFDSLTKVKSKDELLDILDDMLVREIAELEGRETITQTAQRLQRSEQPAKELSSISTKKMTMH
jgi:uncharacterized membrane-anchored protein YjiN (DUF445 family)